jgi:hypothetical protein
LPPPSQPSPASGGRSLSFLRRLAREKSALSGDWPRRLLPVAALLILALGINHHYRLDTALALQQAFIQHIQAEQSVIDARTRAVPLDELNQHLQTSLGAHLATNEATRQLNVSFIKDCRVAQRRGTHLVVNGERGPVNVLMLSDALPDGAPLTDTGLRGRLIRSGGKHTLVVIGNDQEPIDEYLRVLDANLSWEY